MDSVIAVGAQVLPIVPPLVAVLVWWRLARGERGRLAVHAVAALFVTAALVLLAGFVHSDPRPFVVDPSHPALFAHSADNGFPSDHTAYAATAALLVALVRRRLGLILLAVALAGGLARVAANVHHLQDVLGSLVVALVAVGVVTLVLGRIGRIRIASRAPASATHRHVTGAA
jgi:undecaprenyl-diphosphatase